MSLFHFRLQTLLKLRLASRDEARQRLAKAHQAEQLLRERLDRLGADLQQLRAQSRDAIQAGSLDVHRLLQYERYGYLLQSEQQGMRQQQQRVAAELEQRRTLLVEADRQVRILEKLRELRRQQHEQAEQLRDTRQLDEIAGQQHLRSEHNR